MSAEHVQKPVRRPSHCSISTLYVFQSEWQATILCPADSIVALEITTSDTRKCRPDHPLLRGPAFHLTHRH